MPAQTIVQSLAYVNWTVLVSLALGSFGVAACTRLFSDVTRGYVGTTAFLAALLGLLALVSDLSLPTPTGLAIVEAPGLDAPRRVALGGFMVLAFVYVVVVARGGRSPLVAGAALAAGVVAAVLAAVGWGGGLLTGIPLAVQLLVLAAATGGAFGALILGHWYLVTPRLSERPLVLVTRLLTGVVGLQLALFVAWLVTGSGSESPPLAALFGESAMFVWLRLIVGIVFPLALSVMALQTARTRSMESATGLLYINLAAVASGTIVAAGLFFSAGLLV